MSRSAVLLYIDYEFSSFQASAIIVLAQSNHTQLHNQHASFQLFQALEHFQLAVFEHVQVGLSIILGHKLLSYFVLRVQGKSDDVIYQQNAQFYPR